MSTLKKYTLGEVTESIFSGGTPATTNPNFWNGDLQWLSSGETRNRYINETEKSITKEGAINSSTRLALPDDVVIASAGQGFTRGQTSYSLIGKPISNLCYRKGSLSFTSACYHAVQTISSCSQSNFWSSSTCPALLVLHNLQLHLLRLYVLVVDPLLHFCNTWIRIILF